MVRFAEVSGALPLPNAVTAAGFVSSRPIRAGGGKRNRRYYCHNCRCPALDRREVDSRVPNPPACSMFAHHVLGVISAVTWLARARFASSPDIDDRRMEERLLPTLRRGQPSQARPSMDGGCWPGGCPVCGSIDMAAGSNVRLSGNGDTVCRGAEGGLGANRSGATENRDR